MKHTAVFFAALAVSATSVMACPNGNKSKVQATAPAERHQSTAIDATTQSDAVHVAQGTTKSATSTAAE